MNTVVQLRRSRSEKPTVRGGRAKNAEYRQREYLTETEIDKLVATAGKRAQPRFDMRCGSASWWASAGSKSILIPRPSTLPAPRTARLATMAYRVTSCGYCGRFVGSIRTQISYFSPSVRRRCR